MPLKEKELQLYKSFADFLANYEKAGEQEKTDTTQNYNVRRLGHLNLISGESKSALKNKLDGLHTNLQNPFKHLRNWVKGEVMCFTALMQALSEKEQCTTRKNKAQSLMNEE